MNKKSLIIGAAFVDVIMDVPNMPKSGGDVTANFKSNDVGGCAFNVYGAIKHSLGNGSADLFVPVGNGQYAQIVQKVMEKRSIPVLLCDQRKDNGWDLCLVEPSGERTFITVPGIEQCWKDKWFDQINLDDYDYFYLSGYEMEDGQVAEVILNNLSKRNKGSYLLFDASPRISYISRNIRPPRK